MTAWDIMKYALATMVAVYLSGIWYLFIKEDKED